MAVEADVCQLPKIIPSKKDPMEEVVLRWEKRARERHERELAGIQEDIINYSLGDSYIHSCHPDAKWAQRVDKVYLTAVIPRDAYDAEVYLTPEGVFTFCAEGKYHSEMFTLKLFDKVNVEESKRCKINKINTGVRRSIFCVIEKAEKEWWKSLLRANVKPPHYLKVDWDKWVDEENTGAPDLDTGGMDFSQIGVMKAFPASQQDMKVKSSSSGSSGSSGEKKEAALSTFRLSCRPN